MTTNNRILLVASLANSLINFRGDFIQCLLSHGYSVYTASPETTPDVHEKLLALGVVPTYYSLQRTGLNPFKDLKAYLQIKRIIKNNNIDLVFPYTIKPVIYSSVAARVLKVPVISLITGLGFTFSNSSSKAIQLQKVTELLYRLSLKSNQCIIFQNIDDLNLFKSRGLIKHDQKTAVVDGSGVNLRAYAARINENKGDIIRFAVVARLIREKGIAMYLQAAETLKRDFPLCEFHVIGAPDASSTSIPLAELEELHNRKVIVYHGSSDKVPELLSTTDVFVLPTFYREGIPRSILEALSIGMPIITTDTPGCRETVREGENGILIAPKQEAALIEAMRYFIENPQQIKPMGIASRRLAEEKFDVNIINEELLHIIEKVMANT